MSSAGFGRGGGSTARSSSRIVLGGGARIGYNLSDRVGLEVTGDYIPTTNLDGDAGHHRLTVSAGLVLTSRWGTSRRS